MSRAPTGLHLCLFCEGDGQCSACDGTGINPHMNEPEPKCQRCAGTGVCAQCLGTRRAHVRQTEIMEMELDKL